MNAIVTYFYEANLCLLFFGLFYLVFLRNESDLKFRRYFILGAFLIALIAPLLKLGSIGLVTNTLTQVPPIILPELVIEDDLYNKTTLKSTGFTWLGLAYTLVGFILLTYFLFQLMQVAWFTLSRRSVISKKGKIYWIETNGTLPTFSFFNLLFYDNSLNLSKHEQERIITHELEHIAQRHSLDIVLVEVAKIVNWINPIAWYFRSEIQELHEYLADERVIKETDAETYSSLLARMALTQAHLSIGHHFSKSKTLKRIKMMKTIKQKIKTWKLALVLPTMLITSIIVSCNDQLTDAQESGLPAEIEVPADQIFAKVDKPAEPIGGFEKYYQSIAQNMKYPTEARREGIEGKVYVQFVVNEEGSLEDVIAIKGIGGGCDKEAIRAVKSSGSWTAPETNGKKVKQRVVLPITFYLGQGEKPSMEKSPEKSIEIEEV